MWILKFFLATWLIWFIILSASVRLANASKESNGWIDENTKTKPVSKSKFCTKLIFSAIPILRLLFVIMALVIAFSTKENFDKFCEKLKEEKEED